MTITYDHRVIQGAESGAFLRRIDELLQGEDGFYERLFGALGVAPGRRRRRDGAGAGHRRRARALGGRPRTSAASPTWRCSRRCRRPPRSSRRTACTATWPRGSTRSAREPPATPRSTPRPCNLTPELMRAIPASVLRVARAGRDVRRRAARTCRRPTAARSPTRSSTSPTTGSACGCARRSSRASTASRCRAEEQHGAARAPDRRSRRSRATCTRRSSARSSSRSRAWT